MDDAIEFLTGEQVAHCFAVGEIDFVKAERRRLEQIQARLLQADVVVIIKVINPYDLMARLQKTPADVKADKAGRAGNQKFHLQPQCLVCITCDA
ncbi:Hypothetical protein AKI40_1767 [Enterobacter sp. FY-07]|nr:Hypothetical protein AKI40_1767 [Enterobacter sp. FY-07]